MVDYVEQNNPVISVRFEIEKKNAQKNEDTFSI